MTSKSPPLRRRGTRAHRRRATSSARARRALAASPRSASTERAACGRPRPRAPRRARPPRATARRCPRRGRGSAGPVRSWPSQLNSVSRTRSGVGRRPGAAGKPDDAAAPRAADDADAVGGAVVGKAGVESPGGRARMRTRLAAAGKIIALPTVPSRRARLAPRAILPLLDLFKRKPADVRPLQAKSADAAEKQARGASGSRPASRARAKSSRARSPASSPAARSTTRRSRSSRPRSSPPTSASPRPQHLLDDLARAGRRAGGDGDPKALLKAALADLLAPLERPLVVDRRAAVRDHARRRQRRGQDDLDRQARQASSRRRASRCCSPPATPSAPPRASSSPSGASATTSR